MAIFPFKKPSWFKEGFGFWKKKMDKLLFTPGPLTTSQTVKEEMLHDLGSRDIAFIDSVKSIRESLLKLGNVSKDDAYDSILMQGSGTFGIESVISSVIPKDGHLLLIINGAYGHRMAKMAEIHQIKCTELNFEEDQIPDPDEVVRFLKDNLEITHVAIVHCETTTGIINPIEQIGKACRQYNKSYIVDAMSSFGAVPIDIQKSGIDYLISSSNKCIEGVPGFSFIIANTNKLKNTGGNARSLSLDLFNQWKGLETNGQFRFTPPTHCIMAFKQALKELEEEGGVEGRALRYQENHSILLAGMKAMGFKEYLTPEKQGYIITSFLYPEDPRFDFKKFYNLLNDRDYVIYPGKLSKVNCFRIGNIGRLHAEHINALLEAIKEVISKMGIRL